MLNTLLRTLKNRRCSPLIISEFAAILAKEFSDRAIIDFDNIENSRFTLSLLIVFKSRQGTGSIILKRIAEFCDRTGASCYVLPYDDLGTPYNILLSFYEKHGFAFKKHVKSYMIYRPKNLENSLFSHFLG